ncbi:HAMP domain-containing histidine kinase [Bacillus sp. Marseille-Q3570]|uniref:HAMP domain-containing sensor histidine kinase n=1 Tax=Bacillus sp. Marseille-Q3570 TaxID=2963522 RepID=UPI0021B83712|nr:HAMP domain-containing histidine kinase [Bacillus sp. Marseille-Q3570]
MNIRKKIHLFSTIFLFIILLLINGTIYYLYNKVTTEGELDRLTHQTETIASALKEEEISPRTLLPAFIPNDGMIRIINQDSHPILAQAKTNELGKSEAIFQDAQTAEVREIAGESYSVVAIPIIWTNGEVVTLEVTESMAGVQANLDILRTILLLATVLAILPAFLSARVLSELILRPIEKLTSTMEEIQRKRTFKHIEVENQSKDELYKMGTTFNSMVDILQANSEKQQSFVSNASHELRTPLTIIESYASLLKRWGTKKPEVFDESVEAIHSESIRMRNLTEQLLLLARNDDDWEIDWQKVDLVELCKGGAKSFMQAYDRDVRVIHEQNVVFAAGDKQKLKQVLFILFDNAKKFSERDIDVVVEYETGRPSITVKDYGIGIPKEDVAKVFDRFFRVDKARSRKTGGSGLGLSIAKEIIAAHEGMIELESEEGVGTSVRILLKEAH